jgi:hypothetical protein
VTRTAEHRDQYGVAILLVVLTILVAAFAGTSPWGRVLSVVTQGLTLLFILKTSNVSHRAIQRAALFLAIAMLGAIASVVVGGSSGEWIPFAIGAMLALLAPVAIVRRLLVHERVTAQTVFGALCLYLLAALFFALVFSVVGAADGPFFLQEKNATTIDYVYFSFVTLATVGYGDLTARLDLGRMLAVTEALLGQLYLVSIVALLVSNLGRVRSPRTGRIERGIGETTTTPPETTR